MRSLSSMSWKENLSFYLNADVSCSVTVVAVWLDLEGVCPRSRQFAARACLPSGHKSQPPFPLPQQKRSRCTRERSTRPPRPDPITPLQRQQEDLARAGASIELRLFLLDPPCVPTLTRAGSKNCGKESQDQSSFAQCVHTATISCVGACLPPCLPH